MRGLIYDIYNDYELNKMCKMLKITWRTGLCLSELLVVYYMYCFDIITNKLCREEFGLGKTRSAEIFKKLVKLEIAERYGAGAGTYYMLTVKATTVGVEVEEDMGMGVQEEKVEDKEEWMWK